MAHSEAESAGNVVLLARNYERSGRTTGLHLAGVVQQPVIQCGLAAARPRYSTMLGTPKPRHSGQATAICQQGTLVYEQAHQHHARRWSRSIRCCHQPAVVWTNEAPDNTTAKEGLFFLEAGHEQAPTDDNFPENLRNCGIQLGVSRVPSRYI